MGYTYQEIKELEGMRDPAEIMMPYNNEDDIAQDIGLSSGKKSRSGRKRSKSGKKRKSSRDGNSSAKSKKKKELKDETVFKML